MPDAAIGFWREIVGIGLVLGVLWFLARRAARDAVPDFEIILSWADDCEPETRDAVVDKILEDLDRCKAIPGIRHAGIEERGEQVRLYFHGKDVDEIERGVKSAMGFSPTFKEAYAVRHRGDSKVQGERIPWPVRRGGQ